MRLSVPRCANGYYGNPTISGQKCSVCECNGNVDPSEPGYCDSITGECLKCVRHTAGRHCERCQDGYYGDAIIAKNCQGTCMWNSFSVITSSFHQTEDEYDKALFDLCITFLNINK